MFLKKVRDRARKAMGRAKELAEQVSDIVEEQAEKAECAGNAEGENMTRDTNFEEDSKKAVPGLVRMFSGCKDSQTSADVSNTATFGLSSGAGGACTNALLASLKKHDHDITWVKLLEEMREVLVEKRFSQIPQLSSSRNLDLEHDTFSPLHKNGGTGKKRALFIGINYVGQQGELRGCHNDVISMKEYLVGKGFDEVKVLMDDGSNEVPNGANIIQAFDWLVAGAEDGDSLFMHYSGHGGSVRDRDGDEKDGKDETLVPLDYTTNGQITDDMIFEHLVLKVPSDCQLTVLMDCCHSGTILDLPYMVKADKETMTSGNPIAMLQNPNFNMEQLIAVAKQIMQHIQENPETMAMLQKGLQQGLASFAAMKLGN
mmetsp:Transcript_17434/g.22799  ORF Transcript_17434/g.22799 Transcript_17434/m.22799 type:complete len:372 (+) Transcript_17434:99-1214(+)